MRSTAQPASSRRSAQAERTRQNVLAAAREEFAALGLKGARTAAIAAKAGINPHAIFRYFGNKEGLYVAAVRSLFESNWFLSERENLLRLDPFDALESIVDFMIEKTQRDPVYTKILTDVNVNGVSHIQDDLTIGRYYDNMITTIRMIVEKGQSEGIFRTIDPTFIYVSLSMAIAAPSMSRNLYRATLKVDYGDQSELKRYYAALKALVFHGVVARPIRESKPA